MSKQYLGRFIGRTIQFNLDGLPLLGVLQYNVWFDSFKITYSINDGAGEKSGRIRLDPSLIGRIRFDRRQDILKMV